MAMMYQMLEQFQLNGEELFVGAVAMALGTFAMAAALHNRDWYYRLAKARWIEARAGRGAARLFYAAVGLALIALGVAIAQGFGPNKEDPESTQVPAERLGPPRMATG